MKRGLIVYDHMVQIFCTSRLPLKSYGRRSENSQEFPMNNSMERILYDTAVLTFEALGFLSPTAALNASQRQALGDTGMQVEFHGPLSGQLAILICGDILPVLAANMVGEESPPPYHFNVMPWAKSPMCCAAICCRCFRIRKRNFIYRRLRLSPTIKSPRCHAAQRSLSRSARITTAERMCFSG